MDFVQALRGSNDSVVNHFTHQLESVERSRYDGINCVFESIKQKFDALLNDEDSDKPEFLVPELPKPKKEAKGKRKSGKSTTSKVSTKPSLKIQREYVASSSDELSDSVDSATTVRKSSRIASKGSRVPKPEVFSDAQSSLSSCKINCNETYVKQVEASSEIPHIKPNLKIVNKRSKTDQNATHSTNNTFSVSETGYATASEGSGEPPSPSLPPAAKIRCIENVNSGKPNPSRQMLDMSAFAVGIKDEQPLGSSTPTYPLSETFVKVPQHTPNQSDTAKKVKIQKSKLYPELSPSATKTRNQEKILQEKSVNVKLIEEKCEEARKKKEDRMKSSAEEAKRKREERARKVAASRKAATLEKMNQIQKLEAEKESKLKQIEKQKDEKLRLEILKKKQQAAIKADEKRRKEEEKAKSHKIKKPDPESELVEYALDNVLKENESSDDEERPKSAVPSWATKEKRSLPLKIQAYIDKKEMIRPWFFDRSLKYPKLEELFAGVNVKNRPRASSALWNTIIEFDEAFPLHD